MSANISSQVALPNIKFSCINVRSLNLTDKTGAKTRQKLNFLINKGSDIIALSEVKFHDLDQLPWVTNFLAAVVMSLLAD